MNRYPLWKNVLVVAALLLGVLYSLPNLFIEVPAVQVASAKATIKIAPNMVDQVGKLLSDAQIANTGIYFEDGPSPSVKVRLADYAAQAKARDVLEQGLNAAGDPKDPIYVVALNLISSNPGWLNAIHALPMHLGLDLRGGIYFLLQVDMKTALQKRLDNLVGDARTYMRDKNIRHNGIARVDQTIEVQFQDANLASAALGVLVEALPDLDMKTVANGSAVNIVGTFKPASLKAIQDNAIKQNITTLHNRVNQLGTTEPVIQQQGADRIVVQLPGVQDTARAKNLIGRTASLEARLVDSSPEATTALAQGTVPFDDDKFMQRSGLPILVKKQLVFSGDNLTDAQAGFGGSSQEPAVFLDIDAKGTRTVREVTRENVGKQMALLLFENGKGEVITAPVIKSELASHFEISGAMNSTEANDVALLLRSGALAAPMNFIEERTIGPSLGADNIRRGYLSTVYGFCVITAFMMLYYLLFGLVSVAALASNLLLLVAALSCFQTTLTLPGMAAIALTLGMAIDANVLINERIREELRNGTSAQAAIATGYERAFNTILDSNITTLIAGLALLGLGSGPVRGFAVVHCLGIVTSVFSSVVMSRAVVNLIYGTRKKLTKIAIGQVWKPV